MKIIPAVVKIWRKKIKNIKKKILLLKQTFANILAFSFSIFPFFFNNSDD